VSTDLPFPPRTLALNAHRTLEYYAPQDVAGLRLDLKLTRERAVAWQAEAERLRAILKDHEIPFEEADE